MEQQSRIAYPSFDYKSFFRFLSLFIVLYGVDLLWIALTVNGGKYYSAFLQHYLNYPEWIRNSALYLSNEMSHLFGIPSYRSGDASISINNSSGIYMGYSCYGLETMDLWLALIWADISARSFKWLWCLGGLLGIFLINILRITLLLVSLNGHYDVFQRIDNHTFFNVLAYTLIFILVIFYFRSRKRTWLA